MEKQVTEYIQHLTEIIPKFESEWESDKYGFNFGDDSTIYSVFSAFSGLVIERLKKDNLQDREKLFEFIESVISKGGDEANAACTCFLENLLNVTQGEIEAESFVPFLGQASKEFCRRYDKFTGIITEGLH